MAHKVQAFEYSTQDGRARGWLVPCSRNGSLVAAYAVLVPGLSAPWLVEVKYAGRFGLRALHQARSLCGARQWVVGGNGHVHRGSSSITLEPRPMSLPNVLALAHR